MEKKESPMENLLVLPGGTRENEEESEHTIVEAAKANLAAFEVLYERYVMRVYHYMQTRVESEDEARDLTQQVFLRALQALPRYCVRGTPFSAWIFQIARHIATDSYRRRKRNVSWDLLPDMMISSPEQDPELVLLRQEAQTRLQQILTDL